MAYEWGRFMWWLGQGQNAAATQAVAAIATVALTVVLVCVTAKYVVLTNSLAQIAQDQFDLGQQQYALIQKQFLVSSLPQLTLGVYPTAGNWRRISYRYANNGANEMRVISLVVKVTSDRRIYEHSDTAPVGLVLERAPDTGRFHENVFMIPEEIWNEGLADLSQDALSDRLAI
jgi:hypothetical protein